MIHTDAEKFACVRRELALRKNVYPRLVEKGTMSQDTMEHELSVMQEIVVKIRALFHEGLPLAGLLDRRLALDIDLFSRGGMRILDKIEEQGYDVLTARPAISKTERVWLLVGSLARVALRAA